MKSNEIFIEMQEEKQVHNQRSSLLCFFPKRNTVPPIEWENVLNAVPQ